jgi:hypothetical protein
MSSFQVKTSIFGKCLPPIEIIDDYGFNFVNTRENMYIKECQKLIDKTETLNHQIEFLKYAGPKTLDENYRAQTPLYKIRKEILNNKSSMSEDMFEDILENVDKNLKYLYKKDRKISTMIVDAEENIISLESQISIIKDNIILIIKM